MISKKSLLNMIYEEEKKFYLGQNFLKVSVDAKKNLDGSISFSIERIEACNIQEDEGGN